MSAIWFGLAERQRAEAEVQPGSRYRCRLGMGLVATATVVQLQPDHAAIPHVRFLCTVESSGGRRLECETRVLALRSFLRTYSERLPAAGQTPESAA